jgi:hypothetical protein
MRVAGRMAIAGVVVALIGIAAMYLWPEKRWIGWISLVVAGSLLVYWCSVEIKGKFGSSKLSFWVSIAVGALVGGGIAATIWNTSPGDSRPHLHVTKFERWTVPDNAGGRASVKVIFVNDGKSPILKMAQYSKMGYFAALGDEDSGRRFEAEVLLNEPDMTQSALDSQDNEVPAGEDRSFTAESSPWSTLAIQNFMQHRAVVYVAGTITYSAGGAVYKTSYCGYRGAEGGMKFCRTHNREP